MRLRFFEQAEQFSPAQFMMKLFHGYPSSFSNGSSLHQKLFHRFFFLVG